MNDLVERLRAELAQRGEPVAWLNQDDAENALWEAINNAGRIGNPTDDKLILEHLKKRGIWIGNYTATPQRKPLSDEQQNALQLMLDHFGDDKRVQCLRALVERAHGIVEEHA